MPQPPNRAFKGSHRVRLSVRAKASPFRRIDPDAYLRFSRTYASPLLGDGTPRLFQCNVGLFNEVLIDVDAQDVLSTHPLGRPH
jgi:hypothetical protein